MNRLQTVKAQGGLRQGRARGVPRPAGARALALLLAGCAVAAVLVAARAAEPSSAAAGPAVPAALQRARQRRRAQPRRAQPRRPATDYSNFNHATPEHRSPRRECNSCHVVESLAKPEVTDFPDHPSCVECHRQQFFRGARPVICSNCHTVTGPRSEARFPFPRPNVAPDFADVFPHDKHFKQTALGQFRRFLPTKDGRPAHQNESCRFCHKTFTPPATPTPRPAAAAGRAAPARPSPSPSPAGSPEPFVPKPGTYFTTQTNHAACFYCHWQKGVEFTDKKPYASQEPYANECARCHRNEDLSPRPALASSTPVSATPVASASPAPRATPATGQRRVIPAALARIPSQRAPLWPPRVSQKFVHETGGHLTRKRDGRDVVIACVECHTVIRRADTLEALKLKDNQVKLPSCATSACHTAISGPKELTISIFSELTQRAAEPKFECAFCHTRPTSTAEAPCSHYVEVLADVRKANAEREARRARENGERVQKSPPEKRAEEEKAAKDREEREKKTSKDREDRVRSVTPDRCKPELDRVKP